MGPGLLYMVRKILFGEVRFDIVYNGSAHVNMKHLRKDSMFRNKISVWTRFTSDIASIVCITGSKLLYH